MPDIHGLREVIVGIEVLLEGKNVAKPVKVVAHTFDTSLFPGPELRGNVVYSLYALLVGKFGHLEVESGVVDSD